MSLISVLIADHRDLLCFGIRCILEQHPDFVVVAEARTEDEAFDRWCIGRPRLSIIAFDLPPTGGLQICRAILRQSPDARVLMLGLLPSVEEGMSAVAAGANGYLAATADKERLLLAARAAASGEVFLDPAVTRRMMGELTGSTAPTGGEPLSRRELQVLALLTAGQTNKHIADSLLVSEATVKTHVSHILNKLGVERRAEAAGRAISLGLLKSA